MNGHLIPDTPIAVDFWKIRKCGSASIFFLTHIHSDHTVGLTSSWSRPIYCSETTGDLLVKKFSISKDLIMPLELNSPVLIPLNPSHTEMVTVTAIDANHCPGSVMFLFQGYFGTILYTGDFRYDVEMFRGPPLNSVTIDTVYLDNTYCDPVCEFGSRQAMTEEVIKIIENYPEHDVLLGMQSIGKPDLLINIAKKFEEYIGVPTSMYKYLEVLQVPNLFQVDTPEHECRLRVIPAYQVSARLFQHLTRPSIAILTTALYVGLGGSPFANVNSIHIVPYSDHCSFAEIEEFVRRIKPKRIVPIVGREAKGPFNISFAPRADMSRFDPLLSKIPQKEFTIPEGIDLKEVVSNHGLSTDKKKQKRQSLNSKVAKSMKPKTGIVYENSPQKTRTVPNPAIESSRGQSKTLLQESSGTSSDGTGLDNTSSPRGEKVSTGEKPTHASKEKPLTIENAINTHEGQLSDSKEVLRTHGEQISTARRSLQTVEKEPSTPKRSPCTHTEKLCSPKRSLRTHREKASTPERSPHTRAEKAITPKRSPHTRSEKASTPERSPHTRSEKASTPKRSPHTRAEKASTPERPPHTRSEKANTPKKSPHTRSEKASTPKRSPHTRGEKLDTPKESPCTRGKKVSTPKRSPSTRQGKLTMSKVNICANEEESPTPKKSLSTRGEKLRISKNNTSTPEEGSNTPKRSSSTQSKKNSCTHEEGLITSKRGIRTPGEKLSSPTKETTCEEEPSTPERNTHTHKEEPSTPKQRTPTCGEKLLTPTKDTCTHEKEPNTHIGSTATRGERPSTPTNKACMDKEELSTPKKNLHTSEEKVGTPTKEAYTREEELSTHKQSTPTPGEKLDTPTKEAYTNDKEPSTPKQKTTCEEKLLTFTKDACTHEKEPITLKRSTPNPGEKLSTPTKEVYTRGEDPSTPKRSKYTGEKKITSSKKNTCSHEEEPSTPKKRRPTQGEKPTTPSKEACTSKEKPSTPKRSILIILEKLSTPSKDACALEDEPTTSKRSLPTRREKLGTPTKDACTAENLSAPKQSMSTFGKRSYNLKTNASLREDEPSTQQKMLRTLKKTILTSKRLTRSQSKEVCLAKKIIRLLAKKASASKRKTHAREKETFVVTPTECSLIQESSLCDKGLICRKTNQSTAISEQVTEESVRNLEKKISFLNKKASTPEIHSTLKSNNTPENPSTPEIHNTLEILDTPESNSCPEIQSIAKSNNTPEIQSTAKINNTPEIHSTPKTNSTPEIQSTAKSKNAPEIHSTSENHCIPEDHNTEIRSAPEIDLVRHQMSIFDCSKKRLLDISKKIKDVFMKQNVLSEDSSEMPHDLTIDSTRISFINTDPRPVASPDSLSHSKTLPTNPNSPDPSNSDFLSNVTNNLIQSGSSRSNHWLDRLKVSDHDPQLPKNSGVNKKDSSSNSDFLGHVPNKMTHSGSSGSNPRSDRLKLSDHDPGLPKNSEVNENSEKDSSSTTSSFLSTVYNVESSFQVVCLSNGRPQSQSTKRKREPTSMFGGRFHSQRPLDNCNSSITKRKTSIRTCIRPIDRYLQNESLDFEQTDLPTGQQRYFSFKQFKCGPQSSVFTCSIPDYISGYDSHIISDCGKVFSEFVRKQRLRYKP